MTSASPQEGKTTTAVNMAITMAQSGSKVILIDTDMRRPRIHKAFSMSNEFGITSLMLDEVGMDVAIKSTDVPNLSVLPCGPIPPNPAELIHSQKFKEVIDKISQHYDRIVFDSPPVIAVTDSLILGNLVDGVVMVIKSAQTTREVVLRAKNQLTGVNVNIFGAILNDLDLGSKKYGYYYYYYYRRYGYYYGEKDEQSEVNPVSAA